MHYNLSETKAIYQYLKHLKKEIALLLVQQQNTSAGCECLSTVQLQLVSLRERLKNEYIEIKQESVECYSSATYQALLRPALSKICMQFNIKKTIPAYSLQWQKVLLNAQEITEAYQRDTLFIWRQMREGKAILLTQ